MLYRGQDLVLRPMLAWESKAPFDSETHFFEVKWDGYRALAFLEDGTRLQSRNLRDITSAFPVLATLHRFFRGPAVLDGEIVAFWQGRPSFEKLRAQRGELYFLAFDLLFLGDRALLDLPFVRRREMLSRGIEPGGRLLLSEGVPGRGIALFHATGEQGLEGIVAKEMTSPYLPGQRSRAWLKVKHRRRLDCVIGGYTRGRGKRIGGFLLGAYGPEGLRYLGRAGTGFAEEEVAQILRRLAPRASSPFSHALPVDIIREVESWAQPELVCEVEYLEVTREGYLRQPSFVTLRQDKTPTECLLPEDWPPLGGRGKDDGQGLLVDGGRAPGSAD